MSKTILDLQRAKRAEITADADAAIAAAEAEGRDLTADESEVVARAAADVAPIDATIAATRALAAGNANASNPLPSVGGARVTSEPLTYSAENKRERSWISDAYQFEKGASGNREARERMERHLREIEVERRDITSTTLNGLVPPLYVLEQYAALARGSRPFANLVPGYELPADGMTVYVTRTTTGTTTAAQTENGAVSETDVVTTDISIPVVTIAGQQDVSRQAIERGQMTDALLFSDLFESYAETLDTYCLNGTGSNGQHRGILQVSSIGIQTFSTLIVSTFLSKLAGALSEVASNRKRPASLVVMHPRRWHWLLAAADTTGRPIVVPNALGPNNAAAVGETGVGGIVGTIAGGLPVLIDANVPTTASTDQDRVIVTRMSDHALWEDGVRTFSFEQSSAPGQIRLAVWGYSAFTAGRYPTGTSHIVGTGMVAPSF